MMKEISDLLTAVTALAAVLGPFLTVWLQGRANRRVRYETPTLKIEAPTAEEVERLKRE